MYRALSRTHIPQGIHKRDPPTSLNMQCEAKDSLALPRPTSCDTQPALFQILFSSRPIDAQFLNTRDLARQSQIKLSPYAERSASFFTSSLKATKPFKFDCPDFFSGFMVKANNPLKSSYCTNVVWPGVSFEGLNSKTWSPVKMPGKLPRHMSRSAVFSCFASSWISEPLEAHDWRTVKISANVPR